MSSTAHSMGLCLSCPLIVLHQEDTKLFKTRNVAKHNIYVIRDNFSRAILTYKVAIEIYKGELFKNYFIYYFFVLQA